MQMILYREKHRDLELSIEEKDTLQALTSVQKLPPVKQYMVALQMPQSNVVTLSRPEGVMYVSQYLSEVAGV